METGAAAASANSSSSSSPSTSSFPASVGSASISASAGSASRLSSATAGVSSAVVAASALSPVFSVVVFVSMRGTLGVPDENRMRKAGHEAFAARHSGARTAQTSVSARTPRCG